MVISDGGAHILVFPYPAQGHMIPLLDLTHQLAIRGLTITVLVTPKNLPVLNPLLSKSPTVQTLVLPFPNYPSIPPGVENVKDLPVNYFGAMMCALSALYDPILHWFQTHPSPPIAIISDVFLGWTHRLACQLSIPRIVFSPSGAFATSVSNWLWREMPKRAGLNDPNFPICLSDIPNSPICPWYQLSLVYRSYREGDPISEFVKEGMVANMSSWGLVTNTFAELERKYLEHMKGRVWAVGPLLPPPTDVGKGPTERGGSSTVPAGDVLTWLDDKAEHSVVYVCFGSQAVLTRKQMNELAVGLELSGACFVWCVKEATKGHAAGEYGVVPAGFEDRVAGRGLVICGWAPQVSILSHVSIGSFLTHCGWNSVVEGLMTGLPLLAWPMGADQFINARLLVEDLGIAVRVCEGPETVPDSSELARIVAESLRGNRPERIRAVELRRAALSAVKEGGSSFKDLDGLVKDLGGVDLKTREAQGLDQFLYTTV